MGKELSKSDLTEIDGKFYLKCKTVLLPNEQSEIYQDDDGKFCFDDVLKTYGGVSHFNLYLLSKEYIKTGDWYMRFNSGKPEGYDPIRNCDGKAFQNEHFLNVSPDNREYYKIVATNDITLSGEINSIPGLADYFMEEFCKLNTPGEVFVEYEPNRYGGDMFAGEKIYPIGYGAATTHDYNVIAKFITRTYTADEVIVILNDFERVMKRHEDWNDKSKNIFLRNVGLL